MSLSKEDAAICARWHKELEAFENRPKRAPSSPDDNVLRKPSTSYSKQEPAWLHLNRHEKTRLAPTCFWCGALAVAAGAGMCIGIPALVPTAVIPLAAAFFNPFDRNEKQYLKWGLISTAIALPTSLLGPIGPLAAGGVAMGIGAIKKLLDRGENCR